VGSLTQLQKSLIIGSILGDGYIRIFPGRKDALLEINHSFSAKDYVDWKYEVLKNVSTSPPKMRKGNGRRFAYRFYTKQLPEITDLLGIFYRDRKKVVPDDLVFDRTILAVWYMDDGSRCGTNNFYLNTQQFSLADQEKLRAKLENLGLQTTLNKDKSYWRLRIRKSSVAALKQLIGDLLLPSMKYKIELNPVETWQRGRS
jgi:hypothetical protein